MKKLLYILLVCCPLMAQAQTVLSLQDCLEKARTNNRTLKNAVLDMEAASEQKKEAFTKYFPQISANVLAFQAFDKLIKADGTYPAELAYVIPTLADLAGQPYSVRELDKAYGVSASVIEPIYAGGQIHAGNQLATVQQDVMKLQKELDEKQVLQKVTETYWQIAQLKYNLSTIEAADKQLEEVLRQVNQYVKAGVTTRNDLLKVTIRQQELASNRLKLENGEHVLRLLLAQEIGMMGTDVDIQSEISEDGLQKPESVYAAAIDAVNNRQEYQMAQKGVEANKLQIKMERGKLLPTVSVGVMGSHYGLGGLSDSAKQYAHTHATNGYVLGTISIPISDWWGGSHAIKRKKIALQQSQNQLQDAQEQLQIDIESAWSNLQEAYKQIEVAKVSVEQAKENLRMSTDQYKAGTEDLSDLLDAETLNRQTQNTLSEALSTYQVKLSDYLYKTR